MNYFAHGYQYLDDPFFFAGTAVPDWLSVVDRRVRIPSKSAQRFLDEEDPAMAALAAGIVQHHRDDARFHESALFVKLNLEFARRIREWFPEDSSFRPSFLGHILVEILLDAELIQRMPGQLEAYYDALDRLDAATISRGVNRMATRRTETLEAFIPLFSAERFLSDYAEDDKLLKRLNRIMRRVGLPELPEDFSAFLPDARRKVSEQADSLLGAK